jgi:hypothetical protein
VAGTFGHVIQLGRDLLGPSPVPAQPGVLAEGKKLHCDTPGAFCPLGDGQLTRHDVEQTVFRSVRPTPPRLDDGKYPRGNAAAALALPVHLFMAQGHGVVGGIKDPSRFRAEQRVLLDTLRGVATPLKRPPGELAWMVADSKCRQTLWPGEWHDGYYQQGDALVFDPATDSQAIALNGACSGLPPMPAEQAAPAHAALDPILATLPRVPTPGIG